MLNEILKGAFEGDKPNIATASDTTTDVAPTNTTITPTTYTPTITNSSTYTVPSTPLIVETPTLHDTLGTYFDLVSCPSVRSINNADLQTPLNYHISSPKPGYLKQNTPVSSLPLLSSPSSPTTSTSVSPTETQNAVMHLSQIHNLEPPRHQASPSSGNEVNTTRTSFALGQRHSIVSDDAIASTSHFSNLSSALPQTVNQRRLSDNYPATPLHPCGLSYVFINAGTSYQSRQQQSILSNNIHTCTVLQIQQRTSCKLSGFSSSQLKYNELSEVELTHQSYRRQILSRNNFRRLLVTYPALILNRG